MASETGESAASTRARMDAEVWPRVLIALQGGATLRRPTGIKNYYTFCRDERDDNHGIGISPTLIKKLESAGVLVRSGVDRYALGMLPEPVAPPVQTVLAQLQLFKTYGHQP